MFLLFIVAYSKVQLLGTDGTFVLTWTEKNSIKYYFVACRICTEERAYMNIKDIYQWNDNTLTMD